MTIQHPTWRGSMQQVAADAETTFGEPVNVIQATPMAGRGSTQRAYLFEEKVNARAIFDNPTKTAFDPTGKMKRAGDAFVSSRLPQFVFTMRTLDGLPFPLVQGCLIERMETREIYEVTDVDPDGVASTTFRVTEYGKPDLLSGLQTAKNDAGVVVAPVAKRTRWGDQQ